MYAIIKNHIQHIIHQPFTVIGMILLTILFGSILGSSQLQSGSQKIIPTYSTELSTEELLEIVPLLNNTGDYLLEVTSREKVEELLNENSIDLAVNLKRDSFTITTGAQTSEVMLLEAHLYSNLIKVSTVLNAANQLNKAPNEIMNQLEQSKALYPIQETSFNKDDFIYDQSLQSLFGFSLFFVFYTVTFTVSAIVQQKSEGIWNRVLLSPLSKMQMYLGHIVFSLMLGYLQLFIIFNVFQHGLGVDFYGGFTKSLLVIIPFLFAITSLGVLISAFVKNPRQLNALIPLLAVSMAMIGGAYWPIEIVQSEIMMALSKVVPLFYGMEMLKGATYLNWSFDQFLLPTSILFTFGVICMGIGLNIMERKAV
ncbi:ABC transporter permease [Sutcliffiella sp. NC1]|uniref:ABC transporter permease n=1 Tax=Sutcliffiella sp. NC1 TaxID=3004096 RepID=UPI0022DE3805|nr:ABC transporter permease [Sutcliffiella sp. NC1]WBL13627.1 ABC transporter permease [Sutcliffiella sp. NC1]